MDMNGNVYLTGTKKRIYNSYIQIYVFFYFLTELLSGKIPPGSFIRFLKRLLYFLSKMKLNKYVKTGRYIKLNLYVPVFPSEAFFKACRKVLVPYEKMPCISVLLSVTSACRYDCEHCYQKLDKGKDMDIDLLCETAKKLDKMGVAFFNIEGGEPFLVYDKLKKLCESIETGEIWINSTGDAMTEKKLRELKDTGVRGVMFSMHFPDPEKVNSFMKNDKAWENLINGIKLCHQTGLETAANSCLLKEDFYNGNFQKIVELAKELGISIIQLIKPKPSGGWLGTDITSFSGQDLDFIETTVNSYNNEKKYKDYPFIAAQILDEKSDIFGCTAGGTDRFYINAKGDVQPCEFLNISFGNIKEENFEIIYTRMRECFRSSGDQWLCETCSKDIAGIVKENNLTVLPLSKELSQEVVRKWNRGKEADFYRKVRET
jgi:MoaA/NifB/PqqE/SkfB family radical SAM enzyme